jgi:hypothetical protein
MENGIKCEFKRVKNKIYMDLKSSKGEVGDEGFITNSIINNQLNEKGIDVGKIIAEFNPKSKVLSFIVFNPRGYTIRTKMFENKNLRNMGIASLAENYFYDVCEKEFGEIKKVKHSQPSFKRRIQLMKRMRRFSLRLNPIYSYNKVRKSLSRKINDKPK